MKLVIATLLITLGASQPAPRELELEPIANIILSSDAKDADPIWVSANWLEEGDFTPLAPATRDYIYDFIENGRYEDEGCIRISGKHYDMGLAPDLLNRAIGIWVGEVVERVPGFYGGRFDQVGFLVRVRIDEAVRASSEYSDYDLINIFIPAGEFVAGGYCFRFFATRLSPPALGAEILLLPVTPPRDVDGSIWYPWYQEFFYEVDGVLQVGNETGFPADRLRTLSDAVAFVEQGLQQLDAKSNRQ
jgi:hypothetical protein